MNIEKKKVQSWEDYHSVIDGNFVVLQKKIEDMHAKISQLQEDSCVLYSNMAIISEKFINSHRGLK